MVGRRLPSPSFSHGDALGRAIIPAAWIPASMYAHVYTRYSLIVSACFVLVSLQHDPQLLVELVTRRQRFFSVASLRR